MVTVLDRFLLDLFWGGAEARHAAEPYVSPAIKELSAGPFSFGFPEGAVFEPKRGYAALPAGYEKARGYDTANSPAKVYESLMKHARRKGWEIRLASYGELRSKNPNPNEKTFAYEDTENGREVIYLPEDASTEIRTVALLHETIGKTWRLKTGVPHQYMERDITAETERLLTAGNYASPELLPIARMFRERKGYRDYAPTGPAAFIESVTQNATGGTGRIFN